MSTEATSGRKNGLKSSERKFAFLLVLLLAIMGIAPAAILEYINATHAAGEPLSVRVIMMGILLLTAGFLFMAGGLGMWAFRSTMTSERQHMLGRFVDAMEYLSDGLLCLSPEGRVTGANLAVRNMATASQESSPWLNDLFPELTDLDIEKILESKRHYEVERNIVRDGNMMTFRFRSQYEEGLLLLLVCDVTSQRAEERVLRQHAQLQFIGRIARGVAHDFNNILCAISGHAALMQRQGADPEDEKSIQTILDESSRGASLARRLLELSRESPQQDANASLRKMIANTEELLKVALSSGSQVAFNLPEQDLDVALGPSQVEQIVINLGVLIDDHKQAAKGLQVDLLAPEVIGSRSRKMAALSMYACESPESLRDQLNAGRIEDIDRTGGDGVILSVVASLVEEIGGTLLKLTHDSLDVGFRVLLPVDDGALLGDNSVASSAPWRNDFNGWKILLGLDGLERKSEAWEFSLPEPFDLCVQDTLPGVLEQLEKSEAWNLILIDEDLLGAEGAAVLRVITRLHPDTPLIALTHSPDEPTAMALHAEAFQVSRKATFPVIFAKAVDLLGS